MKKILVALLVVVALVMAPTGVQAAVNYFDQTQIVTAAASEPTSCLSGCTYYVDVKCPTGWKVTGGGVVIPTDTSTTYYTLQQSRPLDLRTWRVEVRKNDGSPWPYYPQRYAVCVR